MKHYFITGTDTDCGKTYVVCQLLDWINQQHQSTAQALKPVASGCYKREGRLVSEDVLQLQQHNHDPEQVISQWLYEPPISPHLAARKKGDDLTVKKIAQFCEGFSSYDHLLIEGAGGLFVPLNDKETWLDFLKKTGIPVILVVGIKLGCINHALLTDEVLRMHGISCFGWIANHLDASVLYPDEIIGTLMNKMTMPFLASVSYCGIINDIRRFPEMIDANL